MREIFAVLPCDYSCLCNWEGKKINPYLTSYFTILATHIILLMFCEYGPGGLLLIIFLVLLAQVAVNTILHYSFCGKGEVASFALPLMWASCVLPLYVYCFHVTNNFSSPADRKFLFVLLGRGTLLPILVISTLTTAGYYLTRMIEKNRKE